MKKYYAVAKGRKPGIYTRWSGENGAEVQVKGFSGSLFKSFPTREEASYWLRLPVSVKSEQEIYEDLGKYKKKFIKGRLRSKHESVRTFPAKEVKYFYNDPLVPPWDERLGEFREMTKEEFDHNKNVTKYNESFYEFEELSEEDKNFFREL